MGRWQETERIYPSDQEVQPVNRQARLCHDRAVSARNDHEAQGSATVDKTIVDQIVAAAASVVGSGAISANGHGNVSLRVPGAEEMYFTSAPSLKGLGPDAVARVAFDGTLLQAGYLYHDPCHTPLKLQDPMKTVKALVGDNVLKNERCCGESGTLGVTRPDISTQIRFRKEEELRQGETDLRALVAKNAGNAAELRAPGGSVETGHVETVQAGGGAAVAIATAQKGNIKILTSCPSCLQGLTRFGNDLNNGLLEADYIVVEMANQILGEQWLPQYVAAANSGGIERVLV